MSDRTPADVLYDHVMATLDQPLAPWPGGYPGEVEAALIDAVFSVRAPYGNRDTKTGVVGAVWRWRQDRGEPANDLRILARTHPDTLRSLTNNGRLFKRWKADIVVEAATERRGRAQRERSS